MNKTSRPHPYVGETFRIANKYNDHHGRVGTCASVVHHTMSLLLSDGTHVIVGFTTVVLIDHEHSDSGRLAQAVQDWAAEMRIPGDSEVAAETQDGGGAA